MEGGQPRDADVVVADVPHLLVLGGLHAEVAVRDHHALGAAGGAGGVLEQGGVLGVRFRLGPPLGRGRVDRVRGEPGQLRHARGTAELREDVVAGRGVGEDDRGAGVLDDPQQPFHARGVVRHLERRTGRPGVQAPGERLDELQPRRVQEYGVAAAETGVLQRHRTGPGGRVQLLVGQLLADRLAVVQEGVRHPVRLLAAAGAQRLHQRVRGEVAQFAGVFRDGQGIGSVRHAGLSIRLRRLSGRISVHTWAMCSRHCSRVA